MKSIANKDGVSNDLIIGRGIDTYRSICSGVVWAFGSGRDYWTWFSWWVTVHRSRRSYGYKYVNHIHNDVLNFLCNNIVTWKAITVVYRGCGQLQGLQGDRYLRYQSFLWWIRDFFTLELIREWLNRQLRKWDAVQTRHPYANVSFAAHSFQTPSYY